MLAAATPPAGRSLEVAPEVPTEAALLPPTTPSALPAALSGALGAHASRNVHAEARLSAAARAYVQDVLSIDRTVVNTRGGHSLGSDLVSAVVVDPISGVTAYGRNEAPVHIGPDANPVPLGHPAPEGATSRALHPILLRRLREHDVATRGHPSKPGTHAEVIALNEALWARERHYESAGQRNAEMRTRGHRVTESDLPSFALHTFWNVDSNRPGAQGVGSMRRGQIAPCCANCAQLVRGVSERVGTGIPTQALIAGAKDPAQQADKLRRTGVELQRKLVQAGVEAPGPHPTPTPVTSAPPAPAPPPPASPRSSTIAPHRGSDTRLAGRGAIVGSGIGLATTLASPDARAQTGVVGGGAVASVAEQVVVTAGAGSAGALIEERVARNLAQRADARHVARIDAATTAAPPGPAPAPAATSAPAATPPVTPDPAPPRTAGTAPTASLTAGQLASAAGRRAAGAGAAGAVIATGFAVVDQVGALRRDEVGLREAVGNVSGEAVVGTGAGAAGCMAALGIGFMVGGPVGAVVAFGGGFIVGYITDRGLRAAGVDRAVAQAVGGPPRAAR